MVAATVSLPRSRLTHGFSLVELLLAMALLTLVAWGMVQLILSTRASVDVARRVTVGSALAGEKVEQLRSLVFAYDGAGTAVTDRETDLTVVPERPGGGVGLRSSPADALQRNVEGYCDFLDGRGRAVAGVPSSGAAFVRRWSIRPLAAAPDDGLIIQVRVLDVIAAGRGGRGASDVVTTTVLARWAK
jgi:prepilin-type N-terminal cleavage/methylation domain-containing protein